MNIISIILKDGKFMEEKYMFETMDSWEGEIIVMGKKISFTQEELQLLYAACMSYGDKLSEIIKSIPNERTDKLTDRAKASWNLARKITEYMEG